MRKLIILFITISFFQYSYCQISNTNIVAELKVETTDNISTLISKASNTTDLYYSLRFVFSVISYDSNNNSSKESIEDLFTLDPYESKNLYQASINTFSGNKIIVLLLIYDQDDKLIGKNRVVFNEDEVDKIESEILDKPNDGLEISGIVIDETKTKSGRDFYDLFYFYYTYNNLKVNEVIKIDEMITFRRSTKIVITIDDEIILEFFAQPNEEYIEQMSKISLQKVYKYFKNKEKEKSYITQY